MGFPPEGFESGLRYRARRGDIFVATYPKSGTTWMQHIIYMIRHRGAPLPADRSMNDVFPHLEEVGERRVLALPQPRMIKTHLPFHMVPYHRSAKYICVARNPFDCVVSFYHHTRGFVRHYDFADGSFDDFFECFIEGRVDFGDYFEHLMSWHERAADRNVLFLTYEQMKADQRRAIVAVGRFLGGAWAETVRDQAVLDSIERHCGFDGMRRHQNRWSSARPSGMPPFVRKGIVGDWVNCLSAEQARRLETRLDETTRGTSAADLWDAVRQAVRRHSREAVPRPLEPRCGGGPGKPS
jgi:hypothetical protein